MRNGFPAVAPVVNDHPIAGFLQPRFFGDLGRLEEQMAQNFVVLRLRFGEPWNVLLGNNQEMMGGLRIAVAKGQDEIIFVNDVRRDFARNNFLEDIPAHTTTKAQDKLPCSVSSSFANNPRSGRSGSGNADSSAPRPTIA